MTAIVSGNQTNHILEKSERTLPQKAIWDKSHHLVSIYNDTNDTLKVDFKFSYHDEFYATAANIGIQSQITRCNSGLDIKSKDWCDISIDDDNEFHKSKGVTINSLFQFQVNGKDIYNNYKYENTEKSHMMIQNYSVIDYSRVVHFPCALKIKDAS